MAGERKYMRIPPDSSGKRIALEYTVQIDYDSKPANYIWAPDTFYDTSDGVRMYLYDVYESSATAGVISARFSKNSEYSNQTPGVGTSIIDLANGSVVASVVSVRDIWFNSGKIVGDSNPSNGLEIDGFGSANIRFSEGRPQLDAFGKLRVSGATHLGNYVYSNSTWTSDFAITEIGGATTTYGPGGKSIVLLAPAGSPSEVRTTTNTYHHYTPGSSHLYMATAAVSDPTATGAIREWGLMDSNNGFCFTINEQGVFGVTLRSSASGTTINTFIPQSDFNSDKVNGTKTLENQSRMNLNLFNDNVYWIDIQWHGAGRVRFGVFYNGERIIMHEYFQGNNFPYAVSQTASLPVSYRVQNISSAVPLQIESWSASVWTEHDLDIGSLGGNSSFTSSQYTLTAGPADPLQSLFAFSPQTTTDTGFINRRLYMPTSISAVAFDSTTGEGAPVDIRICLEPTLSNFTWQAFPGTSIQFSDNIIAFDAGFNTYNRVFKGELDNILSSTFNNIQYGSIKNYADNGGTRTNNVVNVTQASPAVVTLGERLVLREDSNPVLFDNITGMTQLNGNNYFINPTSSNTVELFLDQEFTQPLDTTGFSAYTGGGTMSGYFGTRQNWVVFARNLVPNTTTTIVVTFSWKEVAQ